MRGPIGDRIERDLVRMTDGDGDAALSCTRFQHPKLGINRRLIIAGTGDVESLGEAASHGCLRMDPDDAYRVARYLMEHGGQPRDENWFWRIIHFRSEEKSVYLKNPVPLVVRS